MMGRNLLNPDTYENQIDFNIAQKALGLIFSIREGDYKLICINDFESNDVYYELYNLKDDPGEENNIVEENQDIKEKLLSKYYSIINQQPHFESLNELFEKLTDDQKDNLYKDGYF